MHGVTIYDVSDGSKRRSIYADSGKLTFAANRKDLIMRLYKGMMMSAPTDNPGQLSRIYYNQDVLRVRDVANSFDVMNPDSTQKSEREMSICEMQKELENRTRTLKRAYADSLIAAWKAATARGKNLPKPGQPVYTSAGGIGAAYCDFITKYLHVKEASAAELPAGLARQDTSKKAGKKKDDSVYVLVGTIMKKVARDKVPPGAYIPETVSVHPNAAPAATPTPAPANRPVIPPPIGTPPPAAAATNPTPVPTPKIGAEEVNSAGLELSDAKVRLDDARHWRNRYGVEIQKKFSLAVACIVFVLVGAPIALRFPRGGVGLVMGVGFVVFAIYYIGLIGGESLANKNIVSPFWAMWIDNIVFLIIGIVLVLQMGNENTTQRGGQFAERVDAVRAWFQRQRGQTV
jgi:lipopolysaccharide export system permease protein